MKILVKDNESKISDFELEGTDSCDLEEQLCDWFLECSDWDSTVEMIEERMGCKITIIDPSEIDPEDIEVVQ